MTRPQGRSASILDKRTYLAGRTIFKEGDNGDAAYLVESGSVGIYRCEYNLSTKLGVVGPGEIFGEMALIDGAPRMATAITDTAAVIVRIPKSVVEQKIAAADPFVRGMLNLFLKHIRENHKAYIRKPRSIGDSLMMIDAYSSGVEAFMLKSETTKHTVDMKMMIQEVRDLTQRMLGIAGFIKDRRVSVIDAVDVEGASLRDVVKTE